MINNDLISISAAFIPSSHFNCSVSGSIYLCADIGAEIDSDRLDALNKFLNGIDFKISSDEGEAPNGEKYNTIWTYNGTKAQMDYKEQNFLKSEWGAKKLIDKNLTQNSDNNYTLTLYIKDNHKYGTWKPWKE